MMTYTHLRAKGKELLNCFPNGACIGIRAKTLDALPFGTFATFVIMASFGIETKSLKTGMPELKSQGFFKRHFGLFIGIRSLD